MALLSDLFLGNASGAFGNDIVFKTIRGRTFITKRPRPSSKPETKPQRETRVRFKEASAFAKAAMLDAERKEYYQTKSIKLGLPNAYTAALTDYMRTPQVTVMPAEPQGQVVLEVKKKGFEVKKVEVKIKDTAVIIPAGIIANHSSLFITLKKTVAKLALQLFIQDETGQCCCVDYGGGDYKNVTSD